ncbi:MAG: helix-turn-helix domain-containing protein [Azovibrio sp.]|uniref:helix-turn-helix domain-containing protein n=1 Tax=Azovibrio sp. TaxID=1872673 RepID=UPI003C7066C0
MLNHDIPEQCKRKQCEKLLEALEELGGLSTSDARDILGIFHPSGRVMELRRAGHFIDTQLRWLCDSEGRKHKQAVYMLVRRGDK